jgi:Uma2 family endonuclease
MASSADGPQTWERILELWNGVDIPDGLWLLVQVTEEGAVMTPVPGSRHSGTTGRLSKILERAVGDDYFVHQTTGVGVLGKKGGAFVPDFLVVPVKASGAVVHAEDAPLVIEVTSPSNFQNDREVKYHAYAQGGVRQYLLIDPLDPQGPTVTLFTEPEGDEYTKAERFPYGATITLEDPVRVVIDTSQFPLDDVPASWPRPRRR